MKGKKLHNKPRSQLIPRNQNVWMNICKTLLAYSLERGGGGGGGPPGNVLVGVCRPVLQTLTGFHTWPLGRNYDIIT